MDGSCTIMEHRYWPRYFLSSIFKGVPSLINLNKRNVLDGHANVVLSLRKQFQRKKLGILTKNSTVLTPNRYLPEIDVNVTVISL